MALKPVTIDVEALRSAFGFGVAGNFAGHLEQAGEAADFVNVTAAAQMPKGIFPWYAPGSETFLGDFPLSSDTLALAGDGQNVQIEPEMGVFFDVTRGADGQVSGLTPRWVAAFDDCSVRRPGAAKISEKKNWGAASKGIAATGFAVTEIDPDGALANVRLACSLTRDGETHAYGFDSAVSSYTLFGQPLISWLIDRLNRQRAELGTPLEDVGALLAQSGATSVLVGIGASRYEPYGETTFMQEGDEAVVELHSEHAEHRSTLRRCVVRQRV